MSTTEPRKCINEIELLFNKKGNNLYGESVTQLEHALQCAQLAQDSGAEPSLIIAALLHDIGHLEHKDSASAFQQGVDDSHELIGAKFLLRQFGVRVSEPVRLHVAAKRYLCFIDNFYWGNLSDQSKQTLELQGGPMDQSEAQNFSEHAHSKEAVQLRKWDDAAKQKNKETESLSHFLKIAEKYLQAQSISE